MLKELVGIDYKNVLKFFCELSQVPRGSGNNDGISRFLLDFAEQRGLKAVTDNLKNVIIYKPAAPGYENSASVIIQGHMDMVCVTDGTPHDFEKDGLDLFMDGEDLIGARGTTLGGDDGIALAYCMALLDDNTIGHPALEIVLTTDEETGMFGAKALDGSLLCGRYMINVDSEDENVVLVSCAGGMRADGRIELRTLEAAGERLCIEACGLKGGHSGAEIHKERTNASLLLARLLFELDEEYLLIDMHGGEKDNAIPASAKAHIVIRNGESKQVEEKINELAEKYAAELRDSEPDVKILVRNEGAGTFDTIHPVSSTKVLFTLLNAPNGVQVMSSSIPGLVESSLNLGVFEAEGGLAHFRYSLRSSVSTYKWFMRDKLESLFEFMGGECTFDGEYPAWEYKSDSKLREVFCSVYSAQNGHEPRVEALHAGLECGIISEKLPGIDIISIGPDMRDIHTPRERLSASSSVRVYKLIEKLLETMN